MEQLPRKSFLEKATTALLILQGVIILYLLWLVLTVQGYAWLGLLAISWFEVPICLFLVVRGFVAARNKRPGLAALAFLFSLPGLAILVGIIAAVVADKSR